MLNLQKDGTYYIHSKDLREAFTSTDIFKQGIMDWNGNLIWECPYDITIDEFEILLQFGLSHVFLQFTPKQIGENLGELLTGRGFTYDCRHPGLFVDKYTEYVLKNREYDIEMRKIQSDKQVANAWVSTAENVGFGFAFGQGAGAAAAGIGGVIEAVGSWAINSAYDPQIQKQYDSLYKRMTDEISLIGDTITNVLVYSPMYKYELTMDTSTQNRMKADIQQNGYYCDEQTGTLQLLFKNTITQNTTDNYNVNPVFQADNVVVEGACNVIGKQQVVRRLQNGVEFISDDTPVPPTPPGTESYTISNITQDHTIHAEFEVDE